MVFKDIVLQSLAGQANNFAKTHTTTVLLAEVFAKNREPIDSARKYFDILLFLINPILIKRVSVLRFKVLNFKLGVLIGLCLIR